MFWTIATSIYDTMSLPSKFLVSSFTCGIGESYCWCLDLISVCVCQLRSMCYGALGGRSHRMEALHITNLCSFGEHSSADALACWAWGVAHVMFCRVELSKLLGKVPTLSR